MRRCSRPAASTSISKRSLPSSNLKLITPPSAVNPWVSPTLRTPDPFSLPAMDRNRFRSDELTNRMWQLPLGGTSAVWRTTNRLPSTNFPVIAWSKALPKRFCPRMQITIGSLAVLKLSDGHSTYRAKLYKKNALTWYSPICPRKPSMQVAPRTIANLRRVSIYVPCSTSRSEFPPNLRVNTPYSLGPDNAKGVAILGGSRSKQVLPHQADFGPLAKVPPETEIQAGM